MPIQMGNALVTLSFLKSQLQMLIQSRNAAEAEFVQERDAYQTLGCVAFLVWTYLRKRRKCLSIPFPTWRNAQCFVSPDHTSKGYLQSLMRFGEARFLEKSTAEVNPIEKLFKSELQTQKVQVDRISLSLSSLYAIYIAFLYSYSHPTLPTQKKDK